MAEFSEAQVAAIDKIVEHYVGQISIAQRLSRSLLDLFESSEKLAPHIHSMKARAKDPISLKDKLERKLRRGIIEGKKFEITSENLFEQITDLAGVRLLHLYTSQFALINKIVLELLAGEGFKILEGPEARIWDDEYKAIFGAMGIDTIPSERMYTSVHYVVDAGSGIKRTAEIQVRTLAQELWGEVDHAINYPHACGVPACEEQIRVLARVASSCTRLVDSIFFTLDEDRKPKKPTQ